MNICADRLTGWNEEKKDLEFSSFNLLLAPTFVNGWNICKLIQMYMCEWVCTVWNSSNGVDMWQHRIFGEKSSFSEFCRVYIRLAVIFKVTHVYKFLNICCAKLNSQNPKFLFLHKRIMNEYEHRKPYANYTLISPVGTGV